MAMKAEERMLLAKSIFGDGALEKAKVTQGDRPWEGQGWTWQLINKVELDSTRKGKVGLFIRKTVIHIVDPAFPNGQGPAHSVGEDITHAYWREQDTFLGNVKGFLSGTLGQDATTVGEEEIMSVISDDQPLGGTVVEVKGRDILTKKGEPFTVITYVREVPPAELLAALSPEAAERFFGPGGLEQMAALDEGEDGQEDQ